MALFLRPSESLPPTHVADQAFLTPLGWGCPAQAPKPGQESSSSFLGSDCGGSEAGRMILADTGKALMANERIKAAYLGL